MRPWLICVTVMMCGCVMPRHPVIAGGVNGTLAVFGGSLLVYGGSTSETSFERPIGGAVLVAAVLAQAISMTLSPDPDPPSRGPTPPPVARGPGAAPDPTIHGRI